MEYFGDSVLFHLFGQVDEGGEVVAVSVQIGSGSVCAQGIAFVFALFLFEEVAVENLGAHIFQGRAVFPDEVGRDDDLVKQVPCAVVGQCAYAPVKHLPHGVEVPAGLNFLLFFLGSQYGFATVVIGVVVEVAHDDDFRVGVGGHERVGQMLGKGCCRFPFGARLFFSAQPRGPVVHDEVYPFTGQCPRYDQLVTGEQVGKFGGAQTRAATRFERELVFVVDESHVDAAGVGRVVVYDPVSLKGLLLSVAKLLMA